MNLLGRILLKLIIVLYLSCTYEQTDNKGKIKQCLLVISKALKTKNGTEIKKIATEEGFRSILEETDSLRNNNFFDMVTTDIESEYLFEVSVNDSVVVLSLGKPNEVAGATHGYLFLKEYKNCYKIDRYRAGK